MRKLPPARIFGFVATEADVAVLLLRGPSSKVLMVRWNLATDEFELGQWLFATVFADRCALSAEGRLFRYYSQRVRPSYNTIYRLAAICRPPYFTALALWENDNAQVLTPAWTEDIPPRIVIPDIGSVPESYRSRLPKTVWEERGLGWDRLPVDRDVPPDAEWADVDRHGRLLFAREGRIYVRSVNGERELIDLNPLRFRRVKPPKWATEWPD